MTLLQLAMVVLFLAAGTALLLWIKRRFPPHAPDSSPEPSPAAEEAPSQSSARTFCVVGRAVSGVYWQPGQSFTMTGLNTPSGPLTIVLTTHRTEVTGFSKPVPRGLHIEVTGPSLDLETALNTFGSSAQMMLPILVTTMNAPIGTPDLEIAFETTSGREERDYFQQFLREPLFSPIIPRKMDNSLLLAVLGALETHPEHERLRRAMGYYAHALEQWKGPGTELIVLASIYMGMEAMTPVELRAELAVRSLTPQQLAESWGIELKQLDSTVRKRLLFENDEATYEKARKASDGFEHAYRAFPELHADAKEVLQKATGYLRTAVVRRLALEPPFTARLLAPPYDTPFYLHFAKYLRGKLVGVKDNTAAPGQLYPIMLWSSTVTEITTPDDQDPGIRFTDTIKPRLADGVAFAGSSFELWGSGKSSGESKPTFTKAGS
jgi:hypothetical protein